MSNTGKFRQNINSKIAPNNKKEISAVKVRDVLTDAADAIDEIFETFSLADRLGTYNPSTGTYTITETNVTGSIIAVPAFPKGKYFDVVVEGTNAIPSPGTAWKIGDKIISAVTKWDRLPFAIGNDIVSSSKLASDVLYKNFPFSVSAVLNSVVKAAVKKISIQGAFDPSKVITLTVIRRNNSASGSPNGWQILFHDRTGGVTGAVVYRWTMATYTPTSNIERIAIPGLDFALGTTLYLTIDWSEIADGANLNNMLTNYLSALAMEPLQGVSDLSVTESKIADGAVTGGKIAANAISPIKIDATMQAKNLPFVSSASVNTLFKDAILDIKILGNISPERILAVSNLRRGVTDSGVANSTAIRINEFNAGTGAIISPSVYSFAKAAYVPEKDVETLVISGTGIALGTTLFITIDWSKVPAGTNITSGTYANAGISRLTINPVIASPNILDIIMPPSIRILSGVSSEIWFYDRSIVMNDNLFDRNKNRLSLTAKKVSDSSSITPFEQIPGYGKLKPSADEYTATFAIEDYSTYGTSSTSPAIISSKDVNVKTITKPTGSTKNVIVFADSYWDNKYGDGIFEYIMQLAAADGNAVNFKGTRTSHGNLGEARASWAEATFLRYVPLAQRQPVNANTTSSNPNAALVHSPIMYSTDDTSANKYISISSYLTDNNLSSVDTFVFAIGVNGGDGSSMASIIADIRIAKPTAKIIVCMVPGSESLGKIGNNSIVRQINRLKQNISYISKFANRENENIFLCPTHMNFHRRYSLINATQEQVQFNLDSVPLDSINNTSDGHHPTATGAKGIAFMVYNYIMSL